MVILSNNSSKKRYACDELYQSAIFQVQSSEEYQSMKRDQYEEVNQGKKNVPCPVNKTQEYQCS